jgi:hypothetical protein
MTTKGGGIQEWKLQRIGEIATTNSGSDRGHEETAATATNNANGKQGKRPWW